MSKPSQTQLSLAAVLLLIAGTVLFFGGTQFATTASAQRLKPSVAVAPGSGSPGTLVQVAGTGFAGNRLGTVTWSSGSVSPVQVTTDRFGAFSTSIAAPSGEGAITLTAQVRLQRASVAFNLSKDSGTPGLTATPTGTPSPTGTVTGVPSSTSTATPSATSTPPTGTATPPASQQRVVAYLPIWAKNAGYTPQMIDFSAVNVVAHFSVVPRGDGTIEIPNWGPFPDPGLISTAHAAGARVVLVVGGDHAASTTAFSSMAATSSTRALFIQNLMTLVNQQGYDGVDLDWEFPASSSDRANYTKLVAELRQALGTNRTLSIAGPATDWFGQWLDLPGLAPHVDWFGVMTYTFAASSWSSTSGHNSALYGGMSLDASSAYYQSRGVPKSKILLGIPHFGERFDTATEPGQKLTSKSGGWMPYTDVAGLIGNGWTYKRDASAGVPYLSKTSGTGFITFDDPWSVGLKCTYIKSSGLAGVILWHLGQDGQGSNQPLLTAARECR